MSEPSSMLNDVNTRERAEEVLRALAGDSAELREDQWKAIDALVTDRRKALVVQRTGWGKSAVYFVATRLLRDGGAGPTVLISPLLALMRNQIDAAARAGVRAVTVNSDNVDDWDAIYADVVAGEVDVLLVSPERLTNPGFQEAVLPTLVRTAGLVVVDEAHCISDWGHDFRPDYRRITRLIADLPPGTPVLATTATANERVTLDVAEQLGTDALVLRGTMDRASLRLGVLPLGSDSQALAWLDTHLGDLGGPDSGAGIVYGLTVAQVEQTAAFLQARGHKVLPYTGATPSDQRQQAEAALLGNDVEALIATSALGMGYDKPDLGFVVHLGSPQSPVAYYQMVGRAGRATETADVLLIPGEGDRRVWAWFASVGFPKPEQVRDVLAELERGGVMSLPSLEARVDLSRSRLEMMLKVIAVDGAVRRVRGGWAVTGEPWSYDSDRYERVSQARLAEQQAMLDYARGDGCRLRFLREQLDDPDATDCGRCDVCRGAWAPADIGSDSLLAAESHLGRVGLEVEPRRQWPSGVQAVSGRIAPERQALPGIAIASAQGAGAWPARIDAVLSAPDAPPPQDVLDACITALKGHGWPDGRPTAVLSVGSRTRPQLVDGLAEALARIGRMTWLGSLERTPGAAPAARASNSAQSVLAVHRTFTVPVALEPGQLVLLVDDVCRSRWTLTEVAQLLAEEHGVRVLPLVLLAG